MAAIAFKPLGQADPVAATDTDLYAVPAGKKAVGVLFITNRSATATVYRVWVAIAAAATANKQYIAFDITIDGNSVQQIDKISLGATDVLRVRALLATVSFNFMGAES